MSSFNNFDINGKETEEALSYDNNIEAAIDRNPLILKSDTPLLTVIRLMAYGGLEKASTLAAPPIDDDIQSKRVSYVLIAQNEKPIGIITERDIVKLSAQASTLSSKTAADIIRTQQLITLPESSLANGLAVLDLFRQHRIRHLPILNNQGQLVGVVTPESVCQAIRPTILLKLRSIAEVMTKSVIYALPTVPVVELAQLMVAHQVSCIVLAMREPLEPVGSVLRPTGIITERDIVQFQLLELDLQNTLAQTVMSTPLSCLSQEDSLWNAYEIMQRLHVRRLVITNTQGGLAGIITQTSFLNILKPAELYSTISILQQQITARTIELENEISERKRIEQQLFEEKELAQVTLQSIGDAVITTDTAARVTYLNPIAEQLTGWAQHEAFGMPLTDIFVILNETTREPVRNPVELALEEGVIAGLANHTILISKEGIEYGIDDSAAPLRNRDAEIIGTVLVFRDVTRSRQIANQLSWQAGHDALTGLVNRRQFEQILLETLRTIQAGQHHILCYLDLDQFKVINDTCGHSAGDELLRQISALLSRQVRSTDTLARIGGDEFAILLKHCQIERATVISNQIRAVISDFQFIWDSMSFRIGVSIGLAPIDGSRCDMATTLNAADAACYTAKSRGRNQVQLYRADDADIIKQRGQQQWSIRIQQALDEDSFCLYKQQIVSTTPTENNCSYCEILLRMIDRLGNLITPGVFVPAAERYGFMTAIDQWVVKAFFTHLSENLPATQLSELYMINLSGMSIGDEQFLDFLKDQLNSHTIAPETICFEITETAAIANLNRAIDFIQELKKLGFHFALDDFGSGMSSFTYLDTLPIDYLKIDGQFVKSMESSPTSLAIIESINNIAHSMELKTIAEWVETEQATMRLSDIGIDFMQGYAISMPCKL